MHLHEIADALGAAPDDLISGSRKQENVINRRIAAVHLRAQGLCFRQIAEMLHRDTSTIAQQVKQHETLLKTWLAYAHTYQFFIERVGGVDEAHRDPS